MKIVFSIKYLFNASFLLTLQKYAFMFQPSCQLLSTFIFVNRYTIKNNYWICFHTVHTYHSYWLQMFMKNSVPSPKKCNDLFIVLACQPYDKQKAGAQIVKRIKFVLCCQ